jgi:NAD(P)-dependent dehydrogenase (short-subunit alcohol dehydrogenase family)
MNTLEERVALITGAGGGIGSATARTLAARGGWHVLIHDLSEPSLKRLADDLGEAATSLVADLSDMAATATLWQQAWTVKGKIDVLVNNAGFYPPAPLEDSLTDWIAVWDKSLDVHLKAPAVLCREAVNAFAGRPGGGIIINLASRAAFRGEDPEYWHYAAAKAGVVAMTRTIARHYGRNGVTAFAVAPGYVDTDLNAVFRDTVGIQAAADQTGLGEVAGPQDVANIIAFLATGQARHATGTTIDVNGASYVR